MPPLGITSWSRSPWTTRVGTRTSASPAVRSGLAWMASSCRIVPSGLTLRLIAVRTMPPISSASKCGPAMSRNPATPSRSASAGSSGRGVVIDIAMVGRSRGETVPWRRLPVFDMIEHRLSTPLGVVDRQLLGDHPAHRDADDVRGADAEVVEQRHGIGRHVGEQVVGLRVAPVRERLEQRGPRRRRAGSVFVDSPMSRLSIRMTRKPRAARPLDDVARPRDELRTEAHDEQHRLTVLGAVELVLDRHVSELRTGHGTSLAPPPQHSARRPADTRVRVGRVIAPLTVRRRGARDVLVVLGAVYYAVRDGSSTTSCSSASRRCSSWGCSSCSSPGSSASGRSTTRTEKATFAAYLDHPAAHPHQHRAPRHQGEVALGDGFARGRGVRGGGDGRSAAADLERLWLTPTRRALGGPGVVLVVVYGVLALAATGRSVLQIATGFDQAPAGLLALGASRRLVYVLATWCLARGGRWVRVGIVGVHASSSSVCSSSGPPRTSCPRRSPTRRCGRTSARATASCRSCCPSSACVVPPGRARGSCG